MPDKGQTSEIKQVSNRDVSTAKEDFVLEKSIFSNIFEKDIRRVFIYKKAERLAKAIHLITPAFAEAPSLRNRIDAIAVGLVDAAIRPPSSARDALSRELLALSSVLAIARAGSLLSTMNAELISKEAHQLLQEIAAYEEPRLFFEDAPTLAELARDANKAVPSPIRQMRSPAAPIPKIVKGHVSDMAGSSKGHSDRREAILDVLKNKGTIYIKDISTVIRGVSEKTLQRELQKLLLEGVISKTGSRRWTAYTLQAQH